MVCYSCVLYCNLGFEVNEMFIKVVCCYWEFVGCVGKCVIIGCYNVYYGLMVGSVFLGGMKMMYVLGVSLLFEVVYIE